LRVESFIYAEHKFAKVCLTMNTDSMNSYTHDTAFKEFGQQPVLAMA